MRHLQLGIAILVVMTGVAAAQDTWEWIGPEYTSTRAIAVAADGTIYIGGLYMGVRVSEDDGLSWTDVGGPSDLTEMVCTDFGTLICNDTWSSGLLVTADKGASWDQVTVLTEGEFVSQLVVHPLTGDVYAAVEYGGGLFYSCDGGYGWQPVAENLICDQYFDLEAGGNAHLWVKGDTGLWRSEDYAASWLSLAVPPAAEDWGILSFAPSFALFLAGYDTTNYEMHLLRSWDFGDSWMELTENLPVQEWGCYGDIAYGNDWGTMLMADECNGVYRSEDMGDTWALYTEGLSATDVIGLVNGPGGVHYAASQSSGVFKNARDAVAAPDTPAVPRALLAQNHPNPFNPTTTLSFTLAAPGPAKLTLHDAQGRLLRVLADGCFEAGIHALKLGGKGLASGSYIYRLEAGGEVQARRLIVLK